MPSLDQLHNEWQDKFVYTCNNCKSNVETRWHCTVCDDFYLCAKCYTEDGHIHEMQKLGFELGGHSAGADKTQINPQESRRIDIQRGIIAIEHASHCEDINCCVLSQPSCEKVKKIMIHFKICDRKRNISCEICKSVGALICYHAMKCQDNKCPVLFCFNIRRKLAEEKKAEERAKNGTKENSEMLNGSCSKSATSQPFHGSSSRINQSSPLMKSQGNKCPILFCFNMWRKLEEEKNAEERAKNDTKENSKMLNSKCSKSTRQPFYGSLSRTSNSSPYSRPAMPHMVGSPGSYGNITNVNHLTANPALLCTPTKLQQQLMQKPMPQIQPVLSNQIIGVRNMCIWGYSSFNQNILLQGTQPGLPLELRPAHIQMMGAKNMHNPADPACGGGSQVMDNPGTLDPGSMQPKNSEQDLKIKQLLKSLKSSKLSNQKEFLQQKKQVLHVLNSDPQLMAAFINQKSG